MRASEHCPDGCAANFRQNLHAPSVRRTLPESRFAGTIWFVPLLIDGNNLMHAFRKAGMDLGRGGLCRLLGELAAGEKIRVVFDGPPPRGPLAEQIADDRIAVAWAGRPSADEVIAEHIAADSAPRRLTVVSTDRAVRRAARRRRCKVALSEDFAAAVLRALDRPKRPAPAEPAEKRLGLSGEQAEKWMKELQLDEPQSTEPEEAP